MDASRGLVLALGNSTLGVRIAFRLCGRQRSDRRDRQCAYAPTLFWLLASLKTSSVRDARIANASDELSYGSKRLSNTDGTDHRDRLLNAGGTSIALPRTDCGVVDDLWNHYRSTLIGHGPPDWKVHDVRTACWNLHSVGRARAGGIVFHGGTGSRPETGSGSPAGTCDRRLAHLSGIRVLGGTSAARPADCSRTAHDHVGADHNRNGNVHARPAR